MSNKIKHHSDFLSLLVKHAKHPGERKKIVSIASKEEIDACCEIYLNVLKGNANITPSLAKRLRKHKRQCRDLISKKVTLARKKKILSGQTGGFLPLLVSALAPLIGPVVSGISSLFKKR